MAQFPQYAQYPNVKGFSIGAAANTSDDGTGPVVDVWTCGLESGTTAGGILGRLMLWPQGVMPEVKVNVYVWDKTAYKKIGSILLPQVASSGALIIPGRMYNLLEEACGIYGGMELESTQKVALTTSVIVAAGIGGIASGGDF